MNSASPGWPRLSSNSSACPTSANSPSRTGSHSSSSARKPPGNSGATCVSRASPSSISTPPSKTSTSRPPAASTALLSSASPLVSGSATAKTLLVTGATGTGKSYIACAFGHQACRVGLSTRYYRVSRLLDELTLARGDGSYPKLIERLARTWLLILDDWGLASLSGQSRNDLLEVLDDRYARRGTILASQFPSEHWHQIVGDPTFGDAILDRLLNNVHHITLRGASMRRLYDSTRSPSATNVSLEGDQSG